ncbi:MAG: aggregation factor core protein MAFp3, isoform C, partial [Verrucomicrobiaceae bacterium]
VNEAAGTVTLTVTRLGVTTGQVSVAYTTTDATGANSAAAGSDYTASSGIVVFEDGETTKTFTIPITNDLLVESSERFNVSLSTPTGGATIGAQTSTEVTIVDNDQSLQLSAPTSQVNEAAGTVTLTVTRLGITTGQISVVYATSSAAGTAQETTDYTLVTGVLVFEDGETSKTFTIPITNDLLIEESETFGVTLSSPTGGATVGAQATAQVTIIDNDQSLQLSAPTVSVNEAAGTVTLTVTRLGVSTGQVSVAYATSDNTESGSAVAGTDYTATSGVLVFEDGERTKTITIPITNDLLIEPGETFGLTLNSPTGGATLGTQTAAQVTIVDNDLSLQLSTPTATVNEAEGQITLTVTRLGLTTGQASISYTTSNGNAQAGADYTATSGVLTFADGVATLV